jgi:hypothetical protein
MGAMAKISSPCMRVCVVDRDTDLCEGCGRTRSEIARWLSFSEEERLAIMAGLDARMRAAFGGEAPAPPQPVS